MAEADLVTRARRAAGLTNDAAAALLAAMADELEAVVASRHKVWVKYDNEFQSNRLLRAELVRANRQAAPQVTLVACARCGNGVQPRYAHRGLCPACLARELDRAEAEITRLRNRTTTEPR